LFTDGALLLSLALYCLARLRYLLVVYLRTKACGHSGYFGSAQFLEQSQEILSVTKLESISDHELKAVVLEDW
jgi:hypothetical protein